MDKTISVRAHAAILNGEVHRNCIVIYSPDDRTGSPEIVPFTTEIHSTTSYNGVIIFAPSGFKLPPELDMPRANSVPGGFTAFLSKIAEVTPHCGTTSFSPIFLPF